MSGDAPAPAYSVVVADLVADRPALMAMWRSNALQPKAVDAKFDWFYIANPYGKTRQLLLCAGPEAERVGAAGLVTRELWARGEALSAGLLTDFYVAPEHRTLAPAMQLQRQMRKVGLELHDLLYGYPNEKSLPIVKRLGYANLGDLAKFVRLLRYGEYLQRWLPRWASRAPGAIIDRLLPFAFRPHRLLLQAWHGEWVAAADDRFDALWARVKRSAAIVGVRDQRFLTWRFFARPSHQYRVFVLSRQRGGEIAAYAVCEAIGDTFHIRDLLADPQANDAIRVLLHRLSQHAFAEGFVRLSFEFLGNATMRHTLRAAGLFERDKAPLVIGFGPQAKDSLAGLDWYLTPADTEL
ncbi:MAG TPA: hypothetical protein VJ598_05885 [Albitalea sp.]|nr:hypothetical protein [Albitalea sp.]